jgi:hypothetical protein
MSTKMTREPEYYASREARELLNLVSRGEEILDHARAVGLAVQAKLKHLMRRRTYSEDEADLSARPTPSAARDAKRPHH